MTDLIFDDDSAQDEHSYYRPLTIQDLDKFTDLFTSQETLSAIQSAYARIADTNTSYAVAADPQWLNIAAARVAGRYSRAYREVADELYRRAEPLLASALPISGPPMQAAARRVVEEFLGQGPITPLLAGEGELADVRVSGVKDVFIEESGAWRPVDAARFTDDAHLDRIMSFIAGSVLKQRFDETNWVVDSQLPSGDRIHMVHRVVDGSHTMVVRRFPRDTWTMNKILTLGSINTPAALFLSDCVRARFSIGAVGGTGSGKTSLLNALTGCIPDPCEAISVIEDSRELRPHPRLRNIISHRVVTGVNTARDLLKSSLREAPRRIIVGEIRDGIMADFTQAANTGHEGSMTTFHANSSREAFARMRTLYAMGETSGMDHDSIAQNLGLAFDILVTVRNISLRSGSKARRVVEIVAIDYDIDTGTLTRHPIYEYDAETDALARVGGLPPTLQHRWSNAFSSLGNTTLEDLQADQAAAIAGDAAAAQAEAQYDAWSSRETEGGVG